MYKYFTIIELLSLFPNGTDFTIIDDGIWDSWTEDSIGPMPLTDEVYKGRVGDPRGFFKWGSKAVKYVNIRHSTLEIHISRLFTE